MHQSITLIGHLGRNPEMRFLPNGQPVTSFSVAVDRAFTRNGEKVKETLWFNVSAFGKLAESCNTYLAKGKQVYIEGRLTGDGNTGGPRIWKDESGEAHTRFEVTAGLVQFLGRRQEGEGQEAGLIGVDPEEIPF